MIELRDLLELLYLARTRWQTARVTMDDWTHLDRQQDAYERSLGIEGTSQPHAWGEIAATSRTWLESGGRFRQERQGMTLVHDGTKTWIDTPQSGVVEHESQSMRPVGDELLDPAAFLPGFDFRIVGETEIAGRPAIAVEAAPRPRGAGPVDLFPYGADALSRRRPRARRDPAFRGALRRRADPPARGDRDRVRRAVRRTSSSRCPRATSAPPTRRSP